MKKIVAAMLLLCGHAYGQTAPNWVQHQVVTPSQWNTTLAGKQDVNGDVSGQHVTPAGATSTRALSAITADTHNAISYGADPSGVADSTAALNAALAQAPDGLYHNVYLPPPGIYHVTGSLTLSPGQCLFSDNKTRASITVGYDYKSSAGSPLVLTGNAYGTPCVENLSISFSQPASIGSRGNFDTLANGCGTSGKGCKYPAAIDLSAASNTHLSDVWIGNAWDCVHANWTISNGAQELQNIQCGAFDKGLDLTGSVGIVFIDNYHFFPWGITSANNTAIYQDGGTFAASLVTMQGITASNFFSQNGRLASSGGFGMQHYSNLEMDGDNATIEISSGSWVSIDGGYSSGSASGSNTNCALTISAAAVMMSAHLFSNDTSSTVSPVCVSGGSLELTGSDIRLTGTGTSAVSQTGGTLTMAGDQIETQTTGTWTAPLVYATGGQYTITGTTFGVGGGSGVAVSGTDGAANMVADNSYAANWTFTPPGSQGSYEGTTWATYTPSVSCQSGSLTSYTASGLYQRLGKVITLEVTATLTNAGTCGGALIFSLPRTASGQAHGIGKDNYGGATLLGLIQGGSFYVTKYDGSSDATTNYTPGVTIVYEAQ